VTIICRDLKLVQILYMVRYLLEPALKTLFISASKVLSPYESVRAVNSKRPTNLDLTSMQLPLPAKASIIHRISGFVLFFAVAFMLTALAASLESEQSFADLKAAFDNGLVKFIAWGILSALGYHFVAGIKHLLMDMGIGESKEGGRTGAIITLVCGAIVIVLAGVWVW